MLSGVRQKAAISGAEAIIAIKAVGTVMFAKAVTAFRGTEFVIDAAVRPIIGYKASGSENCHARWSLLY